MKEVRGIDENAVSPVVGVMLMLVVTIIIAAVVSGLAGGLMGGSSQKSPTLSMDIAIRNTGSWVGSGFSATVLGVSEPVSTSDLKITTSWSTTYRDNGSVVTGGATVIPNCMDYQGHTNGTPNPLKPANGTGAPYGFGHGVSGDAQSIIYPYSANQRFGNYTLTQGTGLLAVPWGAKPGDEDAVGGAAGHSDTQGYGIDNLYEYVGPDQDEITDATEFALGKEWQHLKPGDSVLVNIIYVPTGKVILSREIKVTE